MGNPAEKLLQGELGLEFVAKDVLGTIAHVEVHGLSVGHRAEEGRARDVALCRQEQVAQFLFGVLHGQILPDQEAALHACLALNWAESSLGKPAAGA